MPRVCLQVDPAKVIILEGILVLHIPELREQCSMRIYVDTGQHTVLFWYGEQNSWYHQGHHNQQPWCHAPAAPHPAAFIPAAVPPTYAQRISHWAQLITHPPSFDAPPNLLVLAPCTPADDDVRLARRIQRDVQDRGRDVTGVLEQYQRFVKPAFDNFVAPSRR